MQSIVSTSQRRGMQAQRGQKHIGSSYPSYQYTIRIHKSRIIVSTFVPDHPSLKAASWANSSPNPSISPLTNGRSTLIAAPRKSPHIVGGEYNIMGELEEYGGEGETSFWEEE